MASTTYYWEDCLVPYGVTHFAHGELDASPHEKRKIASVLAARKVRKIRQPILIFRKDAKSENLDRADNDENKYRQMSISELLNEYPSNSALVDECLVNISHLIGHPSDPFRATLESCWMLYAFDASSMSYAINQLIRLNYIQEYSHEELGHTRINTYQITAKGWERLDELTAKLPFKAERQQSVTVIEAPMRPSKESVSDHDKRYQVFISSTYKDLIEARRAATTGVLESGHMPAGMELFPAANDSSWELIKRVIDESDYYVLIIGGRYGSLDESGISFTEKEYDYAVANNKPVIALFHDNPDSLPRNKTETEEAAWKKLSEFRMKVEKNHNRVTWNNSDELKARLVTSLNHTIRQYPAIGWIRADRIHDQLSPSQWNLERDRRRRDFLAFITSWRERISRTSEFDPSATWKEFSSTVVQFRGEQARVVDDFSPRDKFESLAESVGGLKFEDCFGKEPVSKKPGGSRMLVDKNTRNIIAGAIDKLREFIRESIVTGR